MTAPAVKICGITRHEDATAAAEAGAAFLGFIFVERSPRFIAPETARRIAASLRGRLSLVGVFLDQDADHVNRIADEAGLDLVQLHGSESPEVVASIDRPVIKVLRVDRRLPSIDGYESAEWILYDTWAREVAGGTGRVFEWDALRDHPRERRFFLSGGLRPENVREAIERVRPHAIDVSSGVEDAPGIKSAERIRALFERIGGS